MDLEAGRIKGGRGDCRGNEGGERLEASVGRLGGEYGGSHTPISNTPITRAGSLSSVLGWRTPGSPSPSLAAPPGVRGCVWS